MMTHMKNKLKKYPSWVCKACGLNASNNLAFACSTYHGGTCGVCGKEAMVTEPRDFYYPKFEGFER